ncbi:CMP-N-acetylneuraminate-beta-galactosamide-alpha-2, 3-sialyltransferase, partial [Mannheimia haemolytica]
MNLIICCTPLQVLIAEKIIEMHPNERFYGVMLSTVKNAKFDFYQARLA